ncbi:MAG: response regulator [Pseudomonadota bacterium]
MRKILLIEDEPDQVLMIGERLKAEGYAFISANNGEDGLKKVIEEKPDLVIIDLVIPKIDGFEVCRRMKQNPDTQKIPVIIVSAYAMKEFGKIATDTGADACLKRPHEETELTDTIERLLGDA